MNLSTIKNLMSETRQRLAGLKPGTADIDELAKARLLEREKLNLLSEQEAAEQERLEAKRIADRDKMRTALAKRFRRNAENDLATDNRLVGEAVAAARTLVAALAARHALWTPDGIGLLSDEAQEHFTQGEHSQLAAALAASFQPIRIAEFTAVIREALAGAKPDARDAIGRLFATPQAGPGIRHEAPAARSSAPLIDCARRLEKAPYPAPTEADTPDEITSDGSTAARFEVDLRAPGEIVDNDGPTVRRATPATDEGPARDKFVGGAESTREDNGPATRIVIDDDAPSKPLHFVGS